MTYAARTSTFALIGHGRIGAAVVQAWQGGALPGWQLTGVLVRQCPAAAPPWLTTDREALLAQRPDVVVEAAGPQSLALHAEAALRVADVWTVSPAALADADLMDRIERAGTASGHRLRVLPGAMAGLDGVAMGAVDPAAALTLEVELRPDGQPAALLFEGSVREAARRFPDSVNVAAAAALAGPGLDAAQIRVSRPGPTPSNRLALTSDGAYGTVAAQVVPRVGPGIHPVAACIVAALRRHRAVVWVG